MANRKTYFVHFCFRLHDFCIKSAALSITEASFISAFVCTIFQCFEFANKVTKRNVIEPQKGIRYWHLFLRREGIHKKNNCSGKTVF